MKPPIKNFSLKMYPAGDITQIFGVNKALYAFMGMEGHNGIDVVAPWGTPMYAVEAGIILDTKNDPKGYGKHVRFLSDKADGVIYREWTYGHLAQIDVVVGQRVTAGEFIGLMGNTGFVVSGPTPFWKGNPYKGTHLHLGVRLIKKSRKGWSYPLSDIKINVQNHGNGFKGSIDPTPYLLDTQMEEVKPPVALTRRSILIQIIKLYQEILRRRG